MAAAIPPPDTPRGLRYLALGDSYTIGEGVAPDQRWPEQLARALRAEGIALLDPLVIAQTGWTTDELDAAIDAASAAAPLGGFDFASLLVGVNNQYRGRDVDDYALQFAALLRRTIAFVRDRPARVLVLSIPDWGATAFGSEQLAVEAGLTSEGRDGARVAAELDAYNAAAQAACAAQGVAFVDITGASRAMGSAPAMLAEDGLHPSAAQHRAWMQLAMPAARRALAPAAAA